MRYCASAFRFERRKTREVRVGELSRGGVIIGGDHPVVVQSMLTCDTMDTAAAVQQTLDLAAVGCQIVRITAPTVKDAANLQHIVAELRRRGCHVPIVADIQLEHRPTALMPNGITFVAGTNNVGAKPLYQIQAPLQEMTRRPGTSV